MKRVKNVRLIILLVIVLWAVGCKTEWVKISAHPPENITNLGKTEGKACGSLGLYATAYNFVPLMLNDRIERAIEDALSKAPGAKMLINVTYQEDWFWWVLGMARCVTISGEAVK